MCLYCACISCECKELLVVMCNKLCGTFIYNGHFKIMMLFLSICKMIGYPLITRSEWSLDPQIITVILDCIANVLTVSERSCDVVYY